MVTSTPVNGEIGLLDQTVGDVADPELPHVTIGDLGMIESIAADLDTRSAIVRIIPTYTGCPATEQIADDVQAAADRIGWAVEVETVLHPAWGTERITERGRRRLLAAGIAPPQPPGSGATAVTPIACPRCGSLHTRRVAEFGSTACKASYQCRACSEPFDYFKPY